jgi:malonyl CoA-acyl carrier protein transacylase
LGCASLLQAAGLLFKRLFVVAQQAIGEAFQKSCKQDFISGTANWREKTAPIV